jgi:hypothetical protein
VTRADGGDERALERTSVALADVALLAWEHHERPAPPAIDAVTPSDANPVGPDFWLR